MDRGEITKLENQKPNRAHAIIFDKEGNVLLVKQKSGHISFAGGGIEPEDQTTDDTIKRELLEELRLDPADYAFKKTSYCFSFQHVKVEKGLAISQIYLVELKKEAKITPDLDHISGIIRCSKEEAIDLVTIPELKTLLEKILGKV